MTIDSFIGRIVHTFAYDLDMPVKFDVELDTAGISSEIVERLIDEARMDNFTGTILTEFAVSKIFSNGSWAIDQELHKIGKITFSEKYTEPVSLLASPEYHERFWETLIDYIARQRFSFQTHINALAKQGLGIIDKHGLTIDDFAYKKSGPAGALVRYAEATVPDDFRISRRLDEKKWMAKSAPADIQHRIEAALQDGLETIGEAIIEYIKRHFETFISYCLVQKNIYSEALIHQFIRITEAFKLEKNIVPLFDFSQKVYHVVRNEPVPFLYWRLGSQYHHIMIDEFQDTSHQQWANLRPLVEEALANGFMNMAVGDGKQAIYRFRAGDVKIMENRLFEDLGENIRQNRLDRNFRSRKDIVDFNNQFFSALPACFQDIDDGLFSNLYSPGAVAQKPVSALKGFVKVTPVPVAGLRRKHERQEKILENLTRDIRNILEEQNGYSLQDIAILVRYNNEAAVIAQYLSERGIAVISPDSLLLANAPVVQFIISVLRYITTEDRIALLSIWLFTGQDIKTFETMTASQADPSQLVRTISTRFAESINRLYRLPVYEAIENIIQIFDLNRPYCGFLQGLLDTALNYSEKFSSDIPRFLEWWDDENAATLSSVEHSDAVTLSTIHKAKGLEYPVVLIPFSWDIRDGSGAGRSHFIWVQDSRFGENLAAFPFIVDMQKSLEDSWFRQPCLEEQDMSRIDNLNLLYVAFTRAVDRLYLYTEQKDPDKAPEAPKNTHELITHLTEPMALARTAEGFTLGEKSPKSVSREDLKASASLDTLPAYLWRNKITMKRRAMDLWRLDETDLKEKTETGILIHEILAEIVTAGQITQAIENKVRSGRIGLEDKELYKTRIMRLMDIPYSKGRVGDWFKPGLHVKNERTIAAREQESRPDRVILDQDSAVIIDYKTGQKSPDHAQQINGYGQLLEQMGYTAIDKYLLYIETSEVVEV